MELLIKSRRLVLHVLPVRQLLARTGGTSKFASEWWRMREPGGVPRQVGRRGGDGGGDQEWVNTERERERRLCGFHSSPSS